ncbi:MAG: endolytic transglycosylase MltG [Clostridium sp.]|nr:endolytic transglycosylase MltG [Clostridium sp.]MCM1399096.1 endolytic transglycosylase MltG [Clostridium sp.]MCM1459488.1 endolytic transglycosylase MltG [Bacteroides sp.]
MNKVAGYIKGIILTIAVLALCGQVVNYVKGFYNEYMEEYEGTAVHAGEDVVVVIDEGDSAKTIASKLKDAGLIKYPSAFVRRLKNSPYKGSLHSGTFTLNTGMNTLQMMEVLSPKLAVDEPIDKLVVPEGYTIEMIAERCSEQGICTKKEFLDAVNSVTSSEFEYLKDVPAGADVEYKLQGYIFPATYDIYENTTAESLVDWMLDTFENYYSGDLANRAAELGYSSFEVVTRASIIEREAKIDSERATIAGVINNRLNNGMQLQMCPTVLYPLTNGMYDQAQVYYSDLELDSPYNTYKNTGLPVGPICNPGLACIEAVLYPEEHGYYYYHVADEDAGTHVFTETYEEHLNPQIIYDTDEQGTE